MRHPRRVALVIHFHQPVGNLDMVVRKATDRCYRPFLELLTEHPDVNMTLHYSGCLLEWLEVNAPDVTDSIRDLVTRGQVELMTGGFYEPILAALPRIDRVGQIEMMTGHLRTTYGADPTGLWLTERVWEQDVVESLAEAGVRYTVLDDTMFHSVGITDEQLTGPFVTEQDGRPLLVYAGDRRLRYLIPYKRVSKVIDYINSGDPERLFVYGDDGEKFGEWPDTYERVYKDGWLKDLFSALQAEGDAIELVKLGDHAASAAPVGRVYLPSSSYDEMMTWALPTEARLAVGKARRALQKEDPDGILPFVRGAPWRAFLAKYPEANQLQKRMLHVSRLFHERPSEAARRELYRAQCNCAYWHGAFGGVYLGFMRTALWHHLMKAEASLRPEPGVLTTDVDADAVEEVVMTFDWGAAVVSPQRGGRLIELDDHQVGANLLACAAPRREAYHVEDENPLDEEENEEDEMQAIQARSDVDRDTLRFDPEGTGALLDSVDGKRLVQPYDINVEDDTVVLSTRHGERLEIIKRLASASGALVAGYTLRNLGPQAKLVFGFSSEAFVTPLNLGRESEYKAEHIEAGVRVAEAEGEVGVEITFSVAPDTIETEVVETAAATLEGLQMMSQGVRVRPTWNLVVDPGEAFTFAISLRPVVTTLEDKAERGVSA